MHNSSIPQKVCVTCGQTFPATKEYFYPDGSKFRNDCKECNKASRRAYRATEHGKQTMTSYRKRPDVREKRKVENLTPEQKEYIREYKTRPGVKEREREAGRRHDAKPETQTKRKAYRATDEYRAKGRARMKVRNQSPEYQEKRYIYVRREDVRARYRTYQNTDYWREYRREWAKNKVKTEHDYERDKINSSRRRARVAALPDNFTMDDWMWCLDYWGDKCAVCERSADDTCTLAGDHWIPLSSPDCPGTITSNIVPLCHGVNGCNNSKHNHNPAEWLTRKFGDEKALEILARIQAYFDGLF